MDSKEEYTLETTAADVMRPQCVVVCCCCRHFSLILLPLLHTLLSIKHIYTLVVILRIKAICFKSCVVVVVVVFDQFCCH